MSGHHRSSPNIRRNCGWKSLYLLETMALLSLMIENFDLLSMIFRLLEAFYQESLPPAARISMNLDHLNLGHYRMYRVDAILKTHDEGIPLKDH
ncbi:hypothetical protein Tco_1288649 [Tanacetum coccineum]